MNIISSSEGFSILRNWKTHSTLLWLFSLATADRALKFEVKVVSLDEDGVTVEGYDSVIPFEGAEFFTLSVDESPFPGMAGVRRFLGILRGGEPELIFAEPAIM